MSQGQKLGRYTLIEQLAIGGMAEIWLAHMGGPEGFEKLVVIKKIKPEMTQIQSFVNMFLNEARLAAQLNHPNIVQIYDLGKLEDTYFIAMEYIFGRDLSEILPKGQEESIRFPFEYASKIVSLVCEGLYFAHSKTDHLGKPLNIVHRDISPQNIFVSFSGGVKILDFGIAKASNQLEQTQKGMLKGKVSYMSPEQILGGTLDGRSDLFCLGIVLYELVTGYKLFSGDNDMGIIKSIVDGPIYPPSYFSQKIPEELERIIMKALEKDPDDRYQNAWEMQHDLNQLLRQFDFTPSSIHISNFLKQLFSDEMSKEAKYLEKKLKEVIHDKEKSISQEQLEALIPSRGQRLIDSKEYANARSSSHLHSAAQIDSLEIDSLDSLEISHAPLQVSTSLDSDTQHDLQKLQENSLAIDSEIDLQSIDFLDERPKSLDTPQPRAQAELASTELEILEDDIMDWSVELPDTLLSSPDGSRPKTRREQTLQSKESLQEKKFESVEQDSFVLPFDENDLLDPSSGNGLLDSSQNISIKNPRAKKERLSTKLTSLKGDGEVLFTLRFPPHNYKLLKKMAEERKLSLGDLLHEMLGYALPIFKEEKDSSE